MNLLQGLQVVTTALNLPGPAACARLRELGASIVKVEPPSGDPMQGFSASWYERLHAGIEVRRIDLKDAAGQAQMQQLLGRADVLLTAQRHSALVRMGLEPASISQRHPRLCQVAITGHAPPSEGTPGHDLTYLAAHGLVDPPALPATLFADMTGAERAVSTILALVIARDRSGEALAQSVPLEEAARALAAPLREGLTARGALLGGGYAGYNLYAASEGWIAVAALEPHFAQRLAAALGLAILSAEALGAQFAQRSAVDWERWARERDLPIVAVRTPPTSEAY